MRYNTHIAGGLALGYLAFNTIDKLNVDISDGTTFLIATTGLVLGSLAPDLDIKSSYLSKRIKPISIITSTIFKHRGFTHSLLGTLLITLLIHLVLSTIPFTISIADTFALSFLIGHISHIALDKISHLPLIENLLGVIFSLLAFRLVILGF